MGFCGDFRFERSGKRVLVRDRFTNERIGNINLDDEDIVVRKRRRS